MKRVFITGATGFVGSVVVKKLIDRGYEVAALLRPNCDISRIQSLMDRIKVIYGTLNSIDDISGEIIKFKPNVVAHLAWSGVKGSDRNDLIQLENVGASLELYQLALKSGVEYFLGLGSQAEYGPKEGRISEDCETRPTTLYGVTKLSVGNILCAAMDSSKLPCGWFRLFSTYGPEDNPSWLIPYVANELLHARKPSLTMAEQVWDYLYVDDVADALIVGMELKAKGFYNLGSGIPIPLKEIVLKIKEQIDPLLSIGFGEVAYRPDQVMHLEADTSRIQADLGWRPLVKIDSGIAKTIEWLRKK